MTRRAVILGLLGATLLCACTFFNDMVMRGTFLVGNFLPITVFGGMILVLMLVNPLLGRLSRRAPLTGQEISVAVVLMLFACYIPGRGLMHQFTTFLMLPHHYTRTTPGWQGQPTRVTASQVEDWQALAGRLREVAAGRTAMDALLRDHLPEGFFLAVDGPLGTGSGEAPDQRAILEGLNHVVDDPDLTAAALAAGLPWPDYARYLMQRHGAATTEATQRELSRAVLDVCLEGFLIPRQPAVIAHAPPRMLADPGAPVPPGFLAGGAASGTGETVALDGFVNGLAVGDESLAFRDVPWFAWRRTLWFWLPLIISVCVGTTGLALVIHRQWATHEHLPYPTVEFARALLPGEDGRRSSLFANRLFWLGTAAVFALHMNNYACRWWPQTLIPIRLRFDFYPLLELFPIFTRSGVGIWPMFAPAVYFTVIGFAYFLSTDISLSLGLAPYLFAVFTGTLAGYGVSVNGGMLQPHTSNFFYAGAYCGMFLVLLHTGRRYYSSVFCRALGGRWGDSVETSAVWGGRVFLVGMGLFVVQLMLVGLSWPLAILYTLIMTALFVVISRLVAEAGVFYLHSYFFPCAVLWGVVGAKALGPNQLLIMGMLSSVLLIDPREAFMPFVVSGLQLADQAHCKLGRVAVFGILALLLGFAAAVPATLYLQYQHGAIKAGDGWTSISVPRFAMDATSQVRQRLAAQGTLAAVERRSGMDLLRDASPQTSSLLGFGLMFALVLVFTACRHRFAWWPLHPLLFLVLATWQSQVLAFSFFIGWVIKKAVTVYGGAHAYGRLKPLMIGLVTGEMLAGLTPMIIGAIYYWVTGRPPQGFAIYN